MGRSEPFTYGDGKTRCAWCAGQDDLVAYHDIEWGFPVSDDRLLFEKLCLEGFQSGLSWLTILRKRDAFRRAFAGFDVDRVARFTSRRVDRMMDDPSIVRHRGKLESAIGNARRTRALVGEFGSLAAYVWAYEPDRGLEPGSDSISPHAVALSKDLKKRGFSFVGPTTVHAFMQAMGLINDHSRGCFARPLAERARRAFQKP